MAIVHFRSIDDDDDDNGEIESLVLMPTQYTAIGFVWISWVSHWIIFVVLSSTDDLEPSGW